MKAWLLAVLRGQRDDWRAMREGTKVIVLLLAMVCVAWAAFAIWFSMTYEF